MDVAIQNITVAIQVIALLVWLPLNLLIIAGLLRGEYRRFPFIFAYVIVELLATAAELPAYWAALSRSPQAVDLQVVIYWMDETIAQVLIFLVVMDLIYRATAKLATRRLLRTGLVVGAILFAAISFLIHYTPVKRGLWMTPWTRDLNFSAAILDLALWTLLIASREKDHRLLLLSGALGIQFTGEAIGGSVRQLASPHHSQAIALIGSTLVVSADIVRSYIWWRVFQREKSPAAVPSALIQPKGNNALPH
jgi:hypothetical protein